MNIVTKSYQSLLPFLVVEAISSQNLRYSHMSVRLMDQGWAWLVSGRKLFIWKFKERDSSTNLTKSRRILCPCFELQLPQSDLVHRADLAHVFFMPQNLNTSVRATTVPAALVISPEGSIRFWSSVANERCTESIVADIQGQEFCTLTPLSQLDYLLGTTTGSVFILSIDVNAHDPKNVIVCTPLATSTSLLHGISRRVSNLFTLFGPMSADSGSEMKRPLIAVPKYSQSTIDQTGSSNRPFFIMSSNFKLRQWSRAGDGPSGLNHLHREWDLQRSVQTKLNETLGSNINFWPIDLITTKSNELLFMIVTHEPSPDNTIRYATCVFNPYQAGDMLTNLTILRSHSWRYTNESEEQLLSLRFLERRITSPVCFVYDRKFLFLVNINQDILDAIDYGNQSDGVLGGGIVDGHPLLFTQRDGLIYVEPIISNQSKLNDTSIQLEQQPIGSTSVTSSESSILQITVRHENSFRNSTRIEPMILELDNEDEDDNAESHDMKPTNNSKNDRIEQQPQDTTHNVSTASQLLGNHSASQINQSTNDNKSLSDSVSKQLQETVSVNDILNDNKEFEWVQHIDNRDYAKASEVLSKLAEECDQGDILKDRKETLLALSKLAQLAQ